MRREATLRTSSLYEEVGGVASCRVAASYGRGRLRGGADRPVHLSAPTDRRDSSVFFLTFFDFFLHFLKTFFTTFFCPFVFLFVFFVSFASVWLCFCIF